MLPKRAGMLDRIAKILFGLSIAIVGVGYGMLAHSQKLFPVPQIQLAAQGANSLFDRVSGRLPWYYRQDAGETQTTVSATYTPGLTLVSGMAADRRMAATVVDANGKPVHRWQIDLFDLWPDRSHLPASLQPKERPGTLIHGTVLLPNGDLVFNFERLGLIRLDICGSVVWRLPYRTHHSIYRDESGNFWVPGQITRTEPSDALPNYRPPFEDYTVLEISPAGEILREISVFDLLIANGRRGLLHMATTSDWQTEVTGNTLHLNDVETFPSDMAAGVFRRGDIMISLRNINTVLVFDPDDLRITFISTGQVLRQHDPDFVDGDTISVFDNNNLMPDQTGQASRIVTLSATDGSADIRFAGTREKGFFTDIMGKHQLLANGNILITESRRGRAFEIDRENAVVWEFYNKVSDGLIGVISDAERLPPQFDRTFFETTAARCSAPTETQPAR